jgi:hypothetical protein
MAINTTIPLTNVAPVLHLHGYSIYDMAALYAVANRENQEVEKLLKEKGTPHDDPAWIGTWARTGVSRLAFDRGVSISEMRKALAKAEGDGLIEVQGRGSLAALRRVNRTALGLLKPESKTDMRELAFKRKKNTKFNLGPLDWTKYLKPEDCVESRAAGEVDRIRQRGPVVFPYTNNFERGKAYVWAKNNLVSNGFRFELSNEPGLEIRKKYCGLRIVPGKRHDGTLLKKWSCLLISHPGGIGPAQLAWDLSGGGDTLDAEVDEEEEI